MKRAFMREDFLLPNDTARELFRQVKDLPILDYHCHINPREIWEDRRFENITQVWLGGDHYKWRLMRQNGVPEEEITGKAPDREKFQRFAETLPLAIGNPMYHWCHLELKRYFGYEGVLNGGTAEEIWQLTRKKLLEDPTLSVRGLIQRSHVEVIGTTDDPADDLCWHEKLRGEKNFPVKVLPSFRPDRALKCRQPGFPSYVHLLEEVCRLAVSSLKEFKRILCLRMDFFDKMGCRACDHGLDTLPFVPATEQEAEAVFLRALHGHRITQREEELYITHMLTFLGREYKKRGWVMQLHYNAQRNVNRRQFRLLGPDTGFDCISTNESSVQLSALLNAMEETDSLPRTILYSLSGEENMMIASVAGSFTEPQVHGKVQLGAAWWFQDTKAGMEKQLRDVAQSSLLGNFVGMLTDSRSFLSYTRHEYFRRILCGLIGQWVENGEYPDDKETLASLVRGICCENARAFFGF